MKAKREQWNYDKGCRVWAGKYKNSHNMPHWHYDCELLYVEKGSLNIFCNQHAYKGSAGQAFFIDSEQVHNMHALSEDAVVTVIVFDYDIIKPFAEKLVLSSPLLSGDYKIPELYKNIIREFRENKQLYNYALSCLIAELAIKIFRNEATLPKEKPAHSIKRFKTILTKIDENYEFYDLETAASDMGMNSAYFSRLFHKQN